MVAKWGESERGKEKEPEKANEESWKTKKNIRNFFDSIVVVINEIRNIKIKHAKTTWNTTGKKVAYM